MTASMRNADVVLPHVHVLVCDNRRDATSPLGPGCGDAGTELYDALKDEVARRGAYRSVWITRTACMSICPKRGASVAIHPAQRFLTEVTAADAGALIDDALRDAQTRGA